MRLMSDFTAICAEFPQFRDALAEVRPLIHDPGLRDHFDEVIRELDKAFLDCQQEFPKGVAQMEKEIATSIQKMEEVKKELPELEKQLQAAKESIARQQAPEVQPPAPPPLDPTHGARLRQEIIERYFETARRPVKREGDVTEMESKDW